MARRRFIPEKPQTLLDAPYALIAAELRLRREQGEPVITRLPLNKYIAGAWKVVDGKPFLPNWHIDAIGDHLTAAFDGQIRKLIINIPPSFAKSLTASVIAPTWQWGPNGKPQTRFICVSYDETLAQRDGTKSRSIIESDWYQREWGSVFQLSTDQNEKAYYKNDHHGHRLSLGLGGGVGGHRGDVIIIDDPTNPTEAKSLNAIMEAQDKWNLTLRSRALEDDSVVILIMQRIHNEDLTGYFLAQDEWTHLRLPALYEKEHQCRVFLNRKDEFDPDAKPFFEDPRHFDDEPLHPARKEASADALRVRAQDPWVYAGQYQQRPVPLEGGSIKIAWIQRWTEATLPDVWDDMVIVVDCAFKDQEDNSWVVMECWGRREANAYLLDQVRGHWDLPDTISQLVVFAFNWPRAYAKYVEDKANGPGVVQMLKGRMPGLMSTADDDGGQKDHPVSRNGVKFHASELCLKKFCMGSKEAKLAAVAPYFQARNVFIPTDEAIDLNGVKWVKEYIYEVTNFPKTRFNDQVDATAMGVWKLLSTFAAHVKPSDIIEDMGIGPMVGTMEAAYANVAGTNTDDLQRVAFGPSTNFGSLGRDAFGG